MHALYTKQLMRSFGVLLHEVVTGETPNQRKMLRPLRHACTAFKVFLYICMMAMSPVVDVPSKSTVNKTNGCDDGCAIRAQPTLPYAS